MFETGTNILNVSEPEMLGKTRLVGITGSNDPFFDFCATLKQHRV